MMMVETLSTRANFRSTRKSQFLNGIVSNREKEVLKYMSIGYTSQGIAAALFLSEHTVISHRKNLMIKLEARNSAHLIMKGVRRGLL